MHISENNRLSLVSERNPESAEQGIRDLKLASPDLIPGKLWKEAVAHYFQGEYLSAVIVGGTCAEAAHKSKCRSKGMNTQNVKWANLIDDSVTAKVIIQHVANILNRIREDYRNKWVHVDLDQISSGYTVPITAGTRIETPTETIIESTPEEYKSIFAAAGAQQQALNCLWLTGVALCHFYGGLPHLEEFTIP
jgi:hypothetical protein